MEVLQECYWDTRVIIERLNVSLFGYPECFQFGERVLCVTHSRPPTWTWTQTPEAPGKRRVTRSPLFGSPRWTYESPVSLVVDTV